MSTLLENETNGGATLEQSERYDEEQLKQEVRRMLEEAMEKMRQWDSAFARRNYFLKMKKK